MRSIAIGYQAGQTQQGANTIAIGNLAGKENQAKNSIILNASGESLNAGATGLYISPIRVSTVSSPAEFPMVYNPVTKETKYTNFALLSNFSSRSHGSISFKFNAQTDATHPYVTNSGGYYYMPNSFTPFTQLGPETNGGKDLIIGNSTRPGFIPSSIVIYYATSGISSNSIGLKQESKLFLYYVNPALSPTPFLIDTLHIDADLIPNSDTRIYTPSLYPSATVNAGYALVLQSGATNYMISGYVYMNP